MTTAPALEISCAKPGCHWRGSPGDAPAHDCPTPLADEATSAEQEEAGSASNAFAGLETQGGAPLADENADRTLPFWVVWSKGDTTVIVGTAATLEDAQAIERMVDVGGGLVTIKQMDRPADHAPEPEPEAGMADGDEPVQVAYGDDPTDRREIEAWLVEHGAYDDNGVPQDAKTASLDARLVAFGEDEPEPEPDLDDEPAETGTVAVEPELPAADERPARRPMEVAIAEALEQNADVAAYRWVVIFNPADETREAALIGRGKSKRDAGEIRDKIVERGDLVGEILVAKTQEILARAETLQTVADPESELEATATEGTKPDEAPPANGKSLFDASDYDREDLQIPRVDGVSIDRIAVGFSGAVMLDRSNPDHVALYNRLHLGQEVEMRVAGKVQGTGATGATNKDGDLDVVVGKKTVNVGTVYVLTPEEL